MAVEYKYTYRVTIDFPKEQYESMTECLSHLDESLDDISIDHEVVEIKENRTYTPK